jgi:hypothetical protein
MNIIASIVRWASSKKLSCPGSIWCIFDIDFVLRQYIYQAVFNILYYKVKTIIALHHDTFALGKCQPLPPIWEITSCRSPLVRNNTHIVSCKHKLESQHHTLKSQKRSPEVKCQPCCRQSYLCAMLFSFISWDITLRCRNILRNMGKMTRNISGGYVKSKRNRLC